MNRSTLRRSLVPALLALCAGIWLLAGCIYIPKFNAVIEGKDAAKHVGNADSRKPLRVNHATRDQVVGLLGDPKYVNADGTAMAYTWSVRKGTIFWPICAFMTEDVDRQRTLVLRFDNAGSLRRFSLEEAYGVSLPDDLRPPANQQPARQIPPQSQVPQQPVPQNQPPPPPPGPGYRTAPGP